MRTLSRLAISTAEVLMRRLSQSAETIYLLIVWIHRLAQLFQIWPSIGIDLPLAVCHDFICFVGIHYFKVMYVWRVVEILMDSGLCLVHITRIRRWPPDDKIAEALYSNGNTSRDICVLNW